jgi:hypothetical protein
MNKAAEGAINASPQLPTNILVVEVDGLTLRPSIDFELSPLNLILVLRPSVCAPAHLHQK